jgi:glutamine synthetase
MATAWIDVVWTDLVGRAHALRATRSAVEAGDLEVGLDEVLAGYGPPAPAEGTRLRLVPDPATLRKLPWDDGLSVVIADLYDDSGPSPLCTRSFLRIAADSAARFDSTVVAAVELEFFLVDPATGRPLYPYIDNYNLSRPEAEPVVTAIRNELRAMAVMIEASNPEYSGGQFEVNIAHGGALSAADQGVLLRLYTEQLARRGGFEATFMAKPWTDQSGSGMHVHQSLWRDGQSVFYGRQDTLSAEGRSYLAGLLEAMADLTLLGSPTPNGYHRRADGSFAPTVVAWATDNRTAAVRAVLGNASATRIEQRDACADSNLYLTIGGQILAGLDGMERGLEPPAPVTGNAYTQDLPVLPRTFLEAYDRLRASELARRLLPGPLLDAYLRVLAAEVELVIVSSSDWERERYAEVPLR